MLTTVGVPGGKAPPRALVIATIAILIQTLALVGNAALAAPPGTGSASLEQCRNGTLPSNDIQCTGSAWQNGNLGHTNSHYREGDSVPFRAILTGLPTGTNTLVIEFDATESAGKHAYDYLTTYNVTETDAQPCSGFACGAAATTPIPAPNYLSLASPVVTPIAQRNMTAWNANFSGATDGVTFNAQPTVAEGSALKVSYMVRFTATASTVILSWGGHVASQIDWGLGDSASAISGSPYHMRLLSINGASTGQQDRSIKANAIQPVPTITTQVRNADNTANANTITIGQSVRDLATVTGGAVEPTGSIAFFVCGPGQADPVDAAGCDTGRGTQVGATKTLSGSPKTALSDLFTPPQLGTYCFRAVYTPDELAPYSPFFHTNTTTECVAVGQGSTQTTTLSSPNANNVVPGTAATDTATVSGAAGGPAPTGTVTFFLCGPGLATAANATTGCPTGGTQIGTAKSLAAADPQTTPPSASATSDATSSSQTLGIGLYCWRAVYSGDGNYATSSHTNATTECFTTMKQTSSTATTSSNNTGTNLPGVSVTDSATVTGIAGGPAPTGTITFFLCQPNQVTADQGCVSGGTQVGAAKSLTATTPPVNPPTASATSDAASGTSTTAEGKYCWRAVYSGDTFYNTSSHTNFTTECFTVAKATPGLSTVPRVFPQDSVTFTGLAGSSPFGSVTFNLYSNLTCSGTAVYSEGPITVTGSGPISTNNDAYSIAADGQFSWQVEYTGNANNNAGTTPCDAEQFTVNFTPLAQATE